MISLARRNFHYLIGGVLFMLLSASFEGVQFGAIVPLADRIFTNKPIILPKGMPAAVIGLADKVNSIDRDTIFYGIIFLMPVFYLLKGITGYFRGSFMNKLAQKSVADVKADLFQKYQELSLDFYSQKRQGELMARITHDAPFIGHAYSFALTDLVYQSLLAIMFAVIAFTISWKMLAIILLLFPLNALLIRVIGKTIKKQSIHSQESMADLNSILAETNQGVAIVKAFSREDHEIRRFGEANVRYYKASIKAICRNLLLAPISELLASIAVVIVFWIGGKYVLEGKMSFGVFALFLTSLISIQRPIKKLTEVYGINQQALASSKRVFDILNWKPKIVDAPQAAECPSPKHGISFEEVSFRYNKDEERWIIRDLSHDFEVGKTTALVGPTGCGKTTLINMILRFYDPDQGVIRMDGQEIKGFTVASLRKHMALVTQDMVLFNETIRANLQYGKLDANDDEICEAARQALAMEFIDKMPQGLDTVIGDRGFKLSGGQKQRLCIARAILKNPRILLLDEATSALDAESEFLVQQALDNLMKRRTVIVVAHRLSTIRNADCILVLDSGKIVEKGVHDELLKSSELYSRLASYHFNQ
ncbi:MAG: ABC transporter ATP-binding protein [Candidatus Omnitrophica bacterium]|nr:ABC transporter ATP-binding protein [Candidatus Omnitrophota bacterium]